MRAYLMVCDVGDKGSAETFLFYSMYLSSSKVGTLSSGVCVSFGGTNPLISFNEVLLSLRNLFFCQVIKFT